MRSEENCSAIVRVTRLVVGEKRAGKKGGHRRPRSKRAEGNRELQSKRYHSVKNWLLCSFSSTPCLLISQFLFPQ